MGLRDCKVQEWYRAASLWCLLTLLCFAPSALAQYHLDSWTADDGLPQNSVRAILQTHDGYLWLATLDGLVRFDGVRFTVFNSSNSPGIESNRFTCLYEDRKGTLWIGTADAGLIGYRLGTFSTYPLPPYFAKTIWVTGLAGDAAGDVWALMSDHELVEWNKGRLLPSSASVLEGKEWPHYPIQSWKSGVGFWSLGPSVLKLFIRGKVTTWTRQDGLPSLGILAVGEDEHGIIWIATDAGVAKVVDGKIVKARTASDCLWGGPEVSFVPGPRMKMICSNRRGSLSIFSPNSPEHESTLELPSEVRSLPGLFVPKNGKVVYLPSGLALYEDREGSLWIGTQGRGLYRARKQAITVISREQGLRDRNIYPICQGHDGAIWIGAWPGSVSRFKDGRISNYTKRDGLSGEQITALYEDHAGRLWVGAYGENNGLRVLQHGRFVIPRGLEHLGLVSAILQDREGAFWFGTEDKLVRYKDGVLTTYTTKDGLAGDSIKVIIEDAAGNVCIGSSGGLTRFRNGNFTAYTERDRLPSDGVTALHEDGDGVLWIGTSYGGLGRFKDGEFTRYTVHEGLFNNGVFQILEDGQGNLWMSCDRGIYRVGKRELNEFAAGKRSAITSIAYGKSDGMRNVECNGGRWPAGIKAQDGKLWFPTQDGVAVLDPEAVSTNSQPPPVQIESCLVDGVPVRADGPVRIKPGQDSFEIQYAALSFIHPEQIKFRYEMEGLDRHWVDAATRRTAYYSHVPPGDYTFRVIAANSDGIWNTQGQALAFVIIPPFYRTWWFTLLMFLAAAGAVSLAWHYRAAQLKRAHATQQAFSRQLIDSQSRSGRGSPPSSMTVSASTC